MHSNQFNIYENISQKQELTNFNIIEKDKKIIFLNKNGKKVFTVDKNGILEVG